MSDALAGRVAGAPISWGVCEAPGWGYELPPSVVLSQMAELGLTATELGPTNYLGRDAATVVDTLRRHGLRLVGGFVPVLLHEGADVDLGAAVEAMRTLADAGADIVVLAADAGPGGYEQRVHLDDAQWAHLVRNLDRVCAVASDLGLRSCLHPHVGTAIETRDDVHRLLAESAVPVCLDTGHLAIGGTDPLELVRSCPDRVAHVHLKDVRMSVARQVANGELGFQEGVRRGLFAPLGEGDLDIAGVVAGLEASGFTGWYVLEQDTTLAGPVPPGEDGPRADVRKSIDFLRGLPAPAGR
ncbi:MAG TPA: TIM barrel protein [Actinopolymorphaceae bacterium]